MADERPFRLRRAWPVWVLAAISLLYFVGILWLVGANQEVRGVTTQQLAFVGLGLFLLTILVAIPYFLRRAPPREEPPAGEPAPFREDMQEEPMEVEAPRMAAERWDDERKLTSEQQQGMRVLEYSRPAKSRHRGAVYAKAYVPVTKEFVLRVETLVAEGRDL